jgi:hypothetical protein
MIVIGKRFLCLVLLALAAAMPSGCESTPQGPREEQKTKDVKVGGDKGVVVERSSAKTTVKVGGDRGVVVEHPRDKKDANQR